MLGKRVRRSDFKKLFIRILKQSALSSRRTLAICFYHCHLAISAALIISVIFVYHFCGASTVYARRPGFIFWNLRRAQKRRTVGFSCFGFLLLLLRVVWVVWNIEVDICLQLQASVCSFPIVSIPSCLTPILNFAPNVSLPDLSNFSARSSATSFIS